MGREGRKENKPHREVQLCRKAKENVNSPRLKHLNLRTATKQALGGLQERAPVERGGERRRALNS